jgi:hypothetical protein
MPPKCLSSSSKKVVGLRIFLLTMLENSKPSRLALRDSNIVEASKYGRVFELMPISA